MGQTCKVLHGYKCTQLIRRNTRVRELERKIKGIVTVLSNSQKPDHVHLENYIVAALAIAKGDE